MARKNRGPSRLSTERFTDSRQLTAGRLSSSADDGVHCASAHSEMLGHLHRCPAIERDQVVDSEVLRRDDLSQAQEQELLEIPVGHIREGVTGQ